MKKSVKKAKVSAAAAVYVESVIAGNYVSVDASDPANPIVSATNQFPSVEITDPEGSVNWDPVSSDYGPFMLRASSVGGNPRMYLSYNVLPENWNLVNADDRGCLYGIETDYDDGTGQNKMEMYWQYQFISGFGDPGTCTYRRSIMVQWDKVTNLPTVLFLGSGISGGIQFCLNDGTGNPYQEQVVGKLKGFFNATNFDVYNQQGGTTKALSVDSTTTTAATGLSIKSQVAGDGIHLKAMSSSVGEGLYLDAKGNYPIVLNQEGNGAVLLPGTGAMFVADQTTGMYLFAPKVAALRANTVNVLKVDGSAASAATGVDVISKPVAGGAHVKVTSSGVHEGLCLDGKGAGPIVLNQDGGGVVLLPDSGLSFTGDQDTGMYRPSSDVVSFKAGAQPVLDLNTTGFNSRGNIFNFGPGGVGATNVIVRLNAGGAVNTGAALVLQKNMTNTFCFGHTSALTGGSQNDIGFYNFGTSGYAATIAAADNSFIFTGRAASSSSTGGIGYAAGAGGTVTQAASRTTGVTLNKVSGAITLASASGSMTPTTFTVANSTVAATDVVMVCQKSGADKYIALVTAVAAGSFSITFYTTGGTTTEQPVFNYAVMKAVAA